jgi:deoxyribose-phosphate aldolase
MATIDDRHDAEMMNFTYMFHYGILGIEKTEKDVRDGVKRVLDSGYIMQAVDVEIIYAPLAIEMLGGKMTVHSPVSYPLGNLSLKKKLRDIEEMIKIGVRDSAYCLTYRNILDHRFDLIEEEVRQAVKTNQNQMTIEYNIQATLLNDFEIVEACKAIENGGASTVKLNTGYGWGTDPEEVALVRRVFGHKLDIHPSGNIRTLAQVDEFLKYDVHIIHSQAVFEITEEYLARREKKGEKPQ